MSASSGGSAAVFPNERYSRLVVGRAGDQRGRALQAGSEAHAGHVLAELGVQADAVGGVLIVLVARGEPVRGRNAVLAGNGRVIRVDLAQGRAGPGPCSRYRRYR